MLKLGSIGHRRCPVNHVLEMWSTLDVTSTAELFGSSDIHGMKLIINRDILRGGKHSMQLRKYEVWAASSDVRVKCFDSNLSRTFVWPFYR